MAKIGLINSIMENAGLLKIIGAALGAFMFGSWMSFSGTSSLGIEAGIRGVIFGSLIFGIIGEVLARIIKTEITSGRGIPTMMEMMGMGGDMTLAESKGLLIGSLLGGIGGLFCGLILNSVVVFELGFSVLMGGFTGLVTGGGTVIIWHFIVVKRREKSQEGEIDYEKGLLVWKR